MYQIAKDPATTPAKKQEAITFLEGKKKDVDWSPTKTVEGATVWDAGRGDELGKMIKELKGG